MLPQCVYGYEVPAGRTRGVYSADDDHSGSTPTHSRHMTRLLALLFVASSAVGCAASSPPTLGTEECASAEAICPSGCIPIWGEAVDIAHECTRTKEAICSRRYLGMQAINQCCVRTRDNRIFGLSGSIHCPKEPEYLGWRDCTPDESNSLITMSKVCP